MELLILISACKGGSANKITGIVCHKKSGVNLADLKFYFSSYALFPLL